MPIDRNELELLIAIVRDDIRDFRTDVHNDFVEVKEKQDHTNGRLRKAEQNIAVLNDRAKQATSKATATGASAGAGLIAVIELVKWVYGLLAS